MLLGDVRLRENKESQEPAISNGLSGVSARPQTLYQMGVLTWSEGRRRKCEHRSTMSPRTSRAMHATAYQRGKKECHHPEWVQPSAFTSFYKIVDFP